MVAYLEPEHRSQAERAPQLDLDRPARRWQLLTCSYQRLLSEFRAPMQVQVKHMMHASASTAFCWYAGEACNCCNNQCPHPQRLCISANTLLGSLACFADFHSAGILRYTECSKCSDTNAATGQLRDARRASLLTGK